MEQPVEVPAGAPAPASGRYLEVNVFGNPTGRVVVADRGDPLPDTLQGHAWRLAVSHVAPR